MSSLSGSSSSSADTRAVRRARSQRGVRDGSRVDTCELTTRRRRRWNAPPSARLVSRVPYHDATTTVPANAAASMQVWRAAGLPLDLDRDIHAAPVGQLEDGVDEVVVHAEVRGPRRRRRMRRDVARADPTVTIGVAPARRRSIVIEQADDALADDEDRFSEPRVGVEHHRDRRLEVRGEHPDVGGRPSGRRIGAVGRHDVLGLMRMVHEDEVVHRQTRRPASRPRRPGRRSRSRT